MDLGVPFAQVRGCEADRLSAIALVGHHGAEPLTATCAAPYDWQGVELAKLSSRIAKRGRVIADNAVKSEGPGNLPRDR
jgi:hypothetical protein